MKDFTGEGRIFFTAAGRFEVSGPPATLPTGAQPSEALTLTADFIAALGKHRHYARETDPPAV